ncbi:hypothetical protein E3P89_02210 [Wallemia ichthyophaga]|uniref:Large ribosomal subunit protein mL49 n=2 Tax=Wallemia ichthyophaga TaxID=245174 RepID=A0A4T0H8H6_WALIC|nr:uncharacterized protein J056_003483 [Wallemia ichthyophaga EXF-994]TIA90875.1 hypothetical protein E3P97_02329 [Wallemia ichthyophaga]EOR02921.1 hypothetical protein J056_003483 [Wallemia ichthyophaga EXF-994]TIA99810.1 hypothetical protein E3P95_01953 [Wallemia ichthyophaga]TIB00793.1 hypothetical protein E3P94_02077 [Wallemia ichthyophaga]TIB06580.1 hypothetical protein E3P96_00299 [Wallemia ichthyophaga]
MKITSKALQLYSIARSRTNNLPVYTEYKRGNQISTIIRKVEGDGKSLKQDILTDIPYLDIKLKLPKNQLYINGDHSRQLRQWLESRHF